MMTRTRSRWAGLLAPAIAAPLVASHASLAEDPQPPEAAMALVTRFCHDCHTGPASEGDVDLTAVGSPEAMRPAIRHWQRAAAVVADGQMPPPEAEQPSAADRALITSWLRSFLAAEAAAHAGDPGRVVLRRLNNAEYTYTIRELTGVDSLDPAREFPADGGAGEGFTNTGQSLVMSPALVVKYLDAAKEVASHLVLLPDGLRFSAGSSPRDFTDELLERVRAFYRRFTLPLSEEAVLAQTTVEQGITLDMGREGFLPLRPALEALRQVESRGDATPATLAEIAAVAGVSPKYLAALVGVFGADRPRPAADAATGSLLLDSLREIWRGEPAGSITATAEHVERWQRALWRFNKVGQIGRHLGREDGPAAWMEPVSPLAPRHEVRLPLPADDGTGFVTVHLAATAAGDGPTDDLVVFEQPRLVAAGREDLPLDVVAGGDPAAAAVTAGDIRLEAPGCRTFRLPAGLCAGAELVTAVSIAPEAGDEATVQPSVGVGAFDPAQPLRPELPIVARAGSAGWRRQARGCDDFRAVFPQAVCYVRIVPVDEVVTLNVLYREDDHLRRLMLDDHEAAELDRLWDELVFVSGEPVALEAALEQLTEFATQDRPDLAEPFRRMKPAVEARADAYRQRLVAAREPQLEALVSLAERAFRRPLATGEADELRSLYRGLVAEGLAHPEAVATLLARVLVSPRLLYKLEEPPPGAGPRPVSPHELATRLSYFLWSSPPDDRLLEAAASGRLLEPEGLVAETRRMLRDDRVRRLAVEFGMHWLHVADFAAECQKNEALFPEFAGVRGAIEEETVLFLTDFFREDRSILELLDADHTFLNAELAAHYGIDGVADGDWRRVDGVRAAGRGGVLTLATTLATQAGASRTSPILRGNWLFETILGERLPKPPPDVPLLAEQLPAGLSERQLIELHSTHAACSRCHRQIDPLGFALEGYDAVGRLRHEDAAGRKIDTVTTLPDGTTLAGVDGLRTWLLTDRRDDVVRQFCRKLLGFALGRGVQLSDEPLLDSLVAALPESEYRIGVAIEAIVTSPQFRMIRGRDAPDPFDTDPFDTDDR